MKQSQDNKMVLLDKAKPKERQRKRELRQTLPPRKKGKERFILRLK